MGQGQWAEWAYSLLRCLFFSFDHKRGTSSNLKYHCQRLPSANLFDSSPDFAELQENEYVLQNGITIITQHHCLSS